MKKQVQQTLQASYGKTLLTSVTIQKYLLLFFTDHTFTTLEGGEDTQQGEVTGSYEVTNSPLDLSILPKSFLLKHGLTTEEEHQCLLDAKRQNHLAETEQRERIRLQQLIQKYGVPK